MKKLIITICLIITLCSFGGGGDCNGKHAKGYKDGVWTCFYENGKMQQEGVYRIGSKEGLWKIYHVNGILAAEGEYRESSEFGKWLFYDDNGNLIFKKNY